MEEIEKRDLGNRLLAVFMNHGFATCSIHDFKDYEILPKTLRDKLKYHSDWNRLMPVVTVLKLLKINNPTWKQQIGQMKHFLLEGNKGIVFETAVELVKIYNNLSERDKAILKTGEWITLVDFVPNPTDCGDLIPLKDFVSSCKNGMIMDDDGQGHYATEKSHDHSQEVSTYWKNVKLSAPDWATHVIWFGK